jgi:hypothetical protein
MSSPLGPRRRFFSRSLAVLTGSTSRPVSSCRWRPSRLCLEQLEDRLAPAQLTVTSVLDPVNLTAGTLRYAINQANADAAKGISDTIVFNTAQMGGNVITLQQGQLLLGGGSGTITINGGGQITVSGNNASRVFEIAAGSVTISGMTITGGRSPSGGGVLNFASLALNQDVLTGNQETAGGNGGGAVLSWGGGSSLTINQTTISNNSATWTGGGISLIDGGSLLLTNSTVSGNTSSRDGGGITLQSISHSLSATVENSTIANNTASQYSGGGILNIGYGAGTSATLTILDSTIAGNSAPYAGGVSSWANSGTVTTTYGNTIFAGNSNGNVPYQSGTLTSLGHNLSSDGTGNLTAVGDWSNTAALLAPLGNYGGTTQTMALLTGSPALGAGTPIAGISSDERGLPQPATPDIGAYQSQPPVSFVVSAPSTATAGTGLSITITALDQYGNTATSYAGAATLTSSDGQAAAPAKVTLINGIATTIVTLDTADTVTLTAAAGTIQGASGSITVSPAAAASFAVSAPSTATAGTSFGVTITAKDPYGNIATGFNGTATLGSSDGLSQTLTLSAGIATASVTDMNDTAHTLTLTAQAANGITGTTSVTISPSQPRIRHIGTPAPMMPVAVAGDAWSGYVLQATPGAVSYVQGSWVVPSITGSPFGGTAVAEWVGIDGNNVDGSTTIEQIGTAEDLTGSVPTYYAWWQMFGINEGHADNYGNSVRLPMPVYPGDTISASVSYNANAGTFTLSITNWGNLNLPPILTGPVLVPTFWSFSITFYAPQAQRSCAEWIVEAPSNSAGVVQPLANFGRVTFTNAAATVNGTAMPIDGAGPGTLTPYYISQAQASDSVGLWSDSGGYSSFDVSYI